MIHYLLLRDDGSVFQRGSCPSEREIPAVAGCRTEIITDSDERRPSQGGGPTYRDFRQMEYPPIGDQLDALWKLIGETGVPIEGEAGRLIARIKAVKELHPKDRNY